MIYLSGVSNPKLRELAHPRIGLMVQPGNGLARQAHLFPFWAADNGCYAKPFAGHHWLAWLSRLPRETCLFAVAPDVLGDHVATCTLFKTWGPRIRELGFPVAFVAQDWQHRKDVPWDDIDVLFAGGSVRWKLSGLMYDLALDAKLHGKRIHMGKVNSMRRLRAAASASYDSVDGTFLAYRARKNGSTPLEERGPQEIVAWLRYLERNPFLPMEAAL